jgi:hypothetical protein
MAKVRKAGLDIVVKVADAEGNTQARFLISAGSLWYFRRNAREPSRRYSWRQLVELIEAETAERRAARKPAGKSGAARPGAKTSSSKKS